MDVLETDQTMNLLIEQYNKLPKTGKPTNEEWTVAAAIIEKSIGVLRVVSIGTGSKCIGAKSLCDRGTIVHDAHAEVVARRGFLIYIMEEIRSFHRTGTSHIFKALESGKLILGDDVTYIMATTAVPCGDAAIMPKYGDRISELDTEVAAKRLKLDCETSDIYRTGAKCLPAGSKQDPKSRGAAYHVIGQVRTKPGRGDQTASVSCSDKLARWNAVGVQGALLSLLLLHPIYLTSLVTAGAIPFSADSLERAINARIGQPGKMKFIQSNVKFPATKNKERNRPAAGSISWNISTNQGQVCVEGKRLGATKSTAGQSPLAISKIGILLRFLDIVQEIRTVPDDLVGVDLSALNYRSIKDKAVKYQNCWRLVKDEKFKIWTKKPIDETKIKYYSNEKK